MSRADRPIPSYSSAKTVAELDGFREAFHDGAWAGYSRDAVPFEERLNSFVGIEKVEDTNGAVASESKAHGFAAVVEATQYLIYGRPVIGSDVGGGAAMLPVGIGNVVDWELQAVTAARPWRDRNAHAFKPGSYLRCGRSVFGGELRDGPALMDVAPLKSVARRAGWQPRWTSVGASDAVGAKSKANLPGADAMSRGDVFGADPLLHVEVE